ncbi:MAG: ParB/RepB/Spo0J family partition protein [Oscillospiraceae bacterium]|nr:ParB/RepB/Spo0J family partition protein [Oscillospiraceae bacterium]
MAKKGGLGTGLDALFQDNSPIESEKSIITLSINEVEPNREQPRKEFNESALTELSKSIEKNGIIQPILVRPKAGGSYQIVAGERRWRAARMAGLMEIPVVIREMSDEDAAVFALIENLQREDLNPVEEAEGIRSLIEEFGMTQEEAADRVGKSRTAVTNTLRLLKLPENILSMVAKGKITAGHARALISLEDEGRMLKIANAVIDNNLTVREVEKMVKTALAGENAKPKKREKKRDQFYDEVELALTQTLGRQVKIYLSKGGKGTLEFEFFGKEDLNKLAKEFDR